jgi:hypothetical protein
MQENIGKKSQEAKNIIKEREDRERGGVGK